MKEINLGKFPLFNIKDIKQSLTKSFISKRIKKAKPTPLVVKLEFQDITAPENVEIQIRSDGLVVWINVDGECRFRACRIKSLILNDERTK